VTRDEDFFFVLVSFFYVVFSQSQGLGWERGSGAVAVDPGAAGGAQGTFPYPGEGGEEAGHMPTGVTYVTEKHSFLVKLKGTLTHLALHIIRGGADRRGEEGRYGPGRG